MKPENEMDSPKETEKKLLVRWEGNQDRLTSWDANRKELFQIGGDTIL